LYLAATQESNHLYTDIEPEPAGAEMSHGDTEA
jgi:hypothetical protein